MLMNAHVPSGREGGFSLVEILVSMLVVAVGILAVLGVQMRTLADAQTGVRRAQVVRLIDDLSERMQVNPSAMANLEAYEVDFGNPPVSGADCAATACGGTDLAKYDVASWKQLVQSTLPGGDAQIFTAAGEDAAGDQRRQLGVMVAWFENERETGDTSMDDQLKAPLVVSSSGVDCPEGKICHLQYVQLTSRCVRDSLASTTYYCADGLYLLQ